MNQLTPTRASARWASAINHQRVPGPLLSAVVAFPILWAVGVVLAQIHVLAVQRPWSGTTWIVVAAVPAAFVLGGLLGQAGVRRVLERRGRGADPFREPQSPRGLLVVLLLVGYAELAREFVSAGAVPILSGHIDATRVSLHQGWPSLLTDGLVIVAIVAIATPRRLLSRAALPDVGVALIALLGSAAAGGRQAFAYAIAGFIARALFWRPPRVRDAVAVLGLAVVVFSLVFYVRTGQEAHDAFATELYGRVVAGSPALLVPFIPAYLSLALSFDVLARVVTLFPHPLPFGHGAYDAWSIHTLVHAERLSDVLRHYTPPWVVSTLAGPLWADGGMPIVAFGSLIIGAITSAPYALYRATRRFSHALLAGYFAALALYCVYDNLLTQYKDWVVIAGGLLIVGRRCVDEAATAPIAATAVDAGAAADAPTAADDDVEPDGPPPRRPYGARPRVAVSAWAALLILGSAIVIATADANVTGARRAAAARKAPVARKTVDGWTVLTASASARALATPPAVAAHLGDQLAIDGGPLGPQTIWAFAARPRAVMATPLTVVGRSVRAGAPVALAPPARSGEKPQYAVGRWNGRPAAFEIVRKQDRFTIDVLSLAGPPTVLLHVDTPAISMAAHTLRDVAIWATGQGRSNLVVVDRGIYRGMVVRVYSGASDFQQLELEQAHPLFPGQAWTLLVGSVESSYADLVLVGTDPVAPAADYEVHVIPGDTNYCCFGDQTSLGIPTSVGRTLLYLVGEGQRQPMLYVVDRARRRVFEVRFF